MKLIVGLGNKDDRYKYSRHNVGFMAVDTIAKKLTKGPKLGFSFKRKFKALVYKGVWRGEDICLVKPQTYVNNSGWTVKLMKDFYKIELLDIWVIHDDIDLPIGKLRIRIGGGSGGHNGIESITSHLGTDGFVRYRLGIGRGKLDQKRSTSHNLHRRMITDFVLSPFTQSEIGKLRRMIKSVSDAVILAMEKGLEKTMNRYN